jgi:hypothetical protein
MKRILLVGVKLYRGWISPALHTIFPGECGYRPTCSEYAAEAIELYGAWKGGRMAVWRILRCNPWTRGGFDPVPLPNTEENSEVPYAGPR